jgi:hypothetical protein
MDRGVMNADGSVTFDHKDAVDKVLGIIGQADLNGTKNPKGTYTFPAGSSTLTAVTFPPHKCRG